MLESLIGTASEYILFGACVFMLLGSIYLSFKLRFVQLRHLPYLVKMLRESHEKNDCHHTIHPRQALLTAMSTTLGISTIVAPVIAISLGGPGALFGFLLTSFFGSAATYSEVNLSVKHRQKLPSGKVMGGPMQYLKHILSPGFAKWYAVGCLILMTFWSGAQANQLAAILDSPLLGDYRTPTFITGCVLAVLVLITLNGGIKRVGSLSAKLVPIMFLLYIGSCLWIIFSNVDKLGTIFNEMFQAALAPYALASGTIVGGVVSALRWGIFKGSQVSEAGLGTQAIPHSMAKTDDPMAQGTLAMLSTYTAGFVAFLSGCVALITETWKDPTLPLGITMVAASFEQYFSYFGIAIVTICTLLFGFGTILGNSFNGSQCYGYLTDNRKSRYYFVAMGMMVILGAVLDVKIVWSVVDIVMAAIALPHLAALMLDAYRQPKLSLQPN